MSTGIEDLTARAKQLIAERSYQEAVRACRRVLLSRPDETPVRVLLGKALLALRRYDEVRAEMMAILRIHPQEPAAHRLLGEAHLRAGDPQKARESAQQALDLDPQDEEARELLAEIDEETAPVSATIDRWFDPEAVATVQTQPPSHEDEHTGPQPDVRHFEQQTSIQVDPALTARAVLAEAEATGQLRAPLPSPARRATPPARLGHSSIPPPPASRPPTAGPPRKPTFRTPSAPPPSSMPPPMREHLEQTTAAGRPLAKRDDPLLPPRVPDVTDELSLDDVDSIQSVPGVDDLLGAVQGYDDLDDLEGEPTQARAEGWDPVEELEGEATLVRSADLDEPSRDPYYDVTSPRQVPRPVDPYARTLKPGSFPDDPLPPPPGVDPWEPTPSPVRPPVSHSPLAAIPARTPAVSRSTTPTPHNLREPYPRRGWSKRKRLLVMVTAGVLPIFLGIAAFFGVRSWMRGSAEEEIRTAAVTASNDGLRSSLERAIEIAEGGDLDDPETVALRARLLATAVLEHGADRGSEVEELLSQLSEEERDLPDARAAEAYLLLSRGDVAAASAAAARGSSTNAELWRARALTAIARNDMVAAAAAAPQAVEERPTSPRHVALHALVTTDVNAALRLLAGIDGGEASPAVRVARARIRFDSGSNPVEAADEARAVLDELASIASPYEKAWAHLIRAQHQAAGSDQAARGQALEQATAAAELRPPWDEGFALALAETFLKLGEPGKAREVLRTLPVQPREARRRATLLAEVAVAHGDWDAAEQALEQAGDDATTAWLRGRVLESKGKVDEAQAQYERAMQDRGQAVRARARLGAIALAQGDAAKAIEHLTPAIEVEPASLEVVPPMVRALLAANQAERAEEAVVRALRIREGEPELLQLKAQVDLAQGQAEAALGALRQVVELRPNDAEAHAALGEAARLTGQPDVAREAYDEALELDDDNETALIGQAYLAVEGGDENAIEAAISRAEEKGARGPRLDRVRAEVMVMRGAGQEAVELLTRLAEANAGDAGLWVALGRAQFQAEEDDGASRSFRRALRIDDDHPEAHLGMAMIYLRKGQVGPMLRSIGAAERGGRTRNAGPSFEARVLAARGRHDYELGRFSSAKAAAREALAKDARCAEAHLLLATVALEEGEDPVPHLRNAVAGRAPAPEALGRLASRVRGPEACDLARRYMTAAPRGYDAPDVRDVLARCP